MHKLLISAAAAILSTIAVAQSPLITTYANNNGGAAGGGVYFDLQVNVPITITGLSANLLGTGSMDVLTCPTTRVGNQTNVGAWTLAGTGTVTGAVAGVPTPIVGLPAIALGVGTYGVAFRAVGGVSHNYTNGTGGNQVYSTAELTLSAGEASNTAFLAPLFTPRVVNGTIAYSVGSGTVASANAYGTGCVRCDASVYENFATAAAFDLNGTGMLAVAGSAYTFVPGGAYVAPGAGAIVLPLTDDSETSVTLSQPFPLRCGAGSTSTLTVCSNGYISVATGNGTGFTPSVATMLSAPQTGWWNWHDFNPAAGGAVKFEAAVGGAGGPDVITWDAVFDFATTSPSTWQVAFYPNGNVEWRFLSMSVAGGTGFLLGYSPGGPNNDPGSRDISATLAAGFSVCCADSAGLALAATARPVVGTNVGLTVSNIPAGSPFGALLYGFTRFNPGIPLDNIGMVGCFKYNDALAQDLFLGPLGSSITRNPPFLNPVPNLVGLVIQAQAACYTGTPLAVSSNGVALLIGNL